MHTKRVAVVTDDAHTRAWVESAIGTLDVSIRCYGVAELEQSVGSGGSDLLIVDTARMISRTIEIAEAAVAAGSEVRLLAIVEREELDDLRMPVRFPADFVVRAASAPEVAARVRGLLWPGEEVVADDIIRVDDLALNLATYQASVRGEPVEFTFLEYALFAFLVTHPNRVYSREILLRRVWDTDYFGGARTVDVHVRRIRSKLGPELAARLETVRSVGYLWRR